MPTLIEYLHQPASLVSLLRAALQAPLPGADAQNRMAPDVRRSHPLPGERPRRSAVLLLLHNSPQGVAMPFTLRPTTLAHHSGEICFPGGGAEAQDETLAHTALREAEEELGFTTAQVSLLGRLTSLYIAPSRNIVSPYVGWLGELPELHPDAREVAAVLSIPLQTLLDPESLDTYTWEYQGQLRQAPCYRIGKYCIWGATAMMLSELLEVIRNHVE